MSVNITINNKTVKVESGLTILQACESVGLQIPRFCYHERLSIAGNCRMCLVHLENSVKPVASCAMNVQDGMKIFTDSLVVRKAREGVMEFLLANHPLDCPICDQGGECDLQDQALIFGNDRGRFYESKRAVSDKNCGPLIKTVMTRCIHCTRCVRFSSELSGSPELVTTGRGGKTEIGNYVSSTITSFVSGNMIDLCPVGALTSKPYAFTARSRELKRTETIDTLDSMGSNISVHTAHRKVLRILPVLHEGVNQEWLNDRSRFSYDGFAVQRLLQPMLREGAALKKSSWKSGLAFSIYFLSFLGNRDKIQVSLGNEFSGEGALFLKILSNMFGHLRISFEDMVGTINADFRRNYLFNSTIDGLSKMDSCLVVGSNLSYEMPLFLMRLRKEQRARDLPVGFIGGVGEYGLNSYRLGNSMETFLMFLEGRHQFCTVVQKGKYPGIIIGMGVLGSTNLKFVEQIGKHLQVFKRADWDGVNWLHMGAGKVGFLELGIQNKRFDNDGSSLFLNTFPKDYSNKHAYVGDYGSNRLKRASVVLPCSNSIEKSATYFNLEGRAQRTSVCLSKNQSVLDDYAILGGFAYSMQDLYVLPESLENIRVQLGRVSCFLYNSVGYQNFHCNSSSGKSLVNRYILSNSFSNFYIINARTDFSINMKKCELNFEKQSTRCYSL
jgi:NADH dehydrogenase (ubiquinone) Fe-S protein 1